MTEGATGTLKDKTKDWHEGFSAGWDAAQPHLREGLIQLRLDSLTPTQAANVRHHFDRLGVPYGVISSKELRIAYALSEATDAKRDARLTEARKIVEDVARYPETANRGDPFTARELEAIRTVLKGVLVRFDAIAATADANKRNEK